MATPTPAAHPVLEAVAAVSDALKAVAEVNPTFMDPDAKAVALTGIAAAEAQLAELQLRVVSAAVDVAETDAARDMASWLVAHTQLDHGPAKAAQRLAEALDHRYEVLRRGMADGSVHADQAVVIADALDKLPTDLATEKLAEAEVLLVDLARQHNPKQLRILGRKILQTVDPDTAEERLAKQLEAEEASARRKTRLTFKPCGDGTTRICAVVPDAAAHRLKTYLDAFTSPRQGGKHVDAHTEGPYPRRMGQAFCTFLEHVEPATLPEHGGDATTVIVTISLESLKNELGVGELIGSGPLSAAEIRRLACTANIIPAVLGGNSEVLDLGTSRRLFTRAQRKALIVQHHTCQAEGCDKPASWTEAHHWQPWSKGGRTDLKNAVLLCSAHHHRIHDPRFTADRLPNGDIRFTRRT